jgi:predicted transcriptional regulator
MAYIEPELKEDLERLADVRNRSISNLLETLIRDEIDRMSQTQAAECVELSERNARDFLRSKGLKALLSEGYTPAIFEIEPDAGQARGASRSRGLPLEVVSAYWLWQAFRGNQSTLALCMALMTESPERRFDAAFEVERTEGDRNQRLAQRLEQLERIIESVGLGMALDDDIRWENAYLMQVLSENGIDPYGLPGETP